MRLCDLGESMPEHEEENVFDEDDSPEYEDPDGEEADSNEPELDVKKVLKILQPIIQQRIDFFETVYKEKSMKTTVTKDEFNQKSKETERVERCVSRQTSRDVISTPPARLRPVSKIQSLRSNHSPATPKSRSSLIKSSNIVAITPVKTLSTPGPYREEIEEVVTTTTVTTTRKKIRRVLPLDCDDVKTEHAKRKLSLGLIDEDDHVPKRSGSKSEVLRRKTSHSMATSVTSTKKNRMSLLHVPSSDQSIVLYVPNDVYKYDKKDDDKVLLEPDDLNEAILNQSFTDGSIIESSDDVRLLEESIRLDRNETLIYQKGSIDELSQVPKTKSKVDLLQRLSVLPCPKLCIKKRTDERRD